MKELQCVPLTNFGLREYHFHRNHPHKRASKRIEQEGCDILEEGGGDFHTSYPPCFCVCAFTWVMTTHSNCNRKAQLCLHAPCVRIHPEITRTHLSVSQYHCDFQVSTHDARKIGYFSRTKGGVKMLSGNSAFIDNAPLAVSMGVEHFLLLVFLLV